MKSFVRSIGVLALMAGLVTSVEASRSSDHAAQSSTASAADVTGSWDVAFTTPQGPIPGYMKLKKDGDKLTGVVGSQMGEAPAQAEVKGKDLSIWFTFPSQNGPMEIAMNGKLDGDKAAGTFSFGGQPGGEWTATRSKESTTADAPKEPAKDTKAPAPSAKLDLTGGYDVSLELPNMSATPTFTLKQDGEKLTGEYVSQTYGKFPLTGTVKGSDVTFSFTMAIEGNNIDVTYTGAADKDGGLKGAVNYGDMMSGTFTATKKK